MNLTKVILFPFEILFEERSVTKGLYILLNGDVELSTKDIPNIAGESHRIEFAEIMNRAEKTKNKKQFLFKNKKYTRQPIDL